MAEWTEPEHAAAYLERADTIPHRREGESVLLELLPEGVDRVLDLGTGDGRLIRLIRAMRPACRFVGLDVSPAMLAAAREHFVDDPGVEIAEHDLARPLPDLGSFDAVVSSFAIHHVEDERKRVLYGEIFACLAPGGVLCNLEHVASPTERLHLEFLDALGIAPEDEDPSNRLAPVEAQLAWLREIGFVDVDCVWKWRELALLFGRRDSA